MYDSLDDYLGYEVSWDYQAVMCEAESRELLLDLFEDNSDLAEVYIHYECVIVFLSVLMSTKKLNFKSLPTTLFNLPVM